MKTVELKLARIGNSRGVRLPAALIRHFQFSGTLTAETRADGLLLRPRRRQKLSWEDTAREMAAGAEDWSEWDGLAADGLENCVWDVPVVDKGSRTLPKKP